MVDNLRCEVNSQQCTTLYSAQKALSELEETRHKMTEQTVTCVA